MYEIRRMPEFDQWFDGLRDRMTKLRLTARLRKASSGNLGDVKPVGEGVYEMREFFGPGWGMYFVRRRPVQPTSRMDHEQEDQSFRTAGVRCG
ncbi:type II toxin-antitoxin system RelE/ParE family toxin [Variovorax sp. J22P271]|nr:type II toxin-antitoxin system RelE/ParE family toxin [Variovorax sp. J22P271]MDM0035502.1 type II toxin-antitoxin system RelE/ParE family toxin [Variovorax sp. J22P271]